MGFLGLWKHIYDSIKKKAYWKWDLWKSCLKMQIYVVIFHLPGILKNKKKFKNITITKRWNSEKNNCITTNKSLRKCVIHGVGDWQLTNPKNYRIALSTYLITEFRSWVFEMLWNLLSPQGYISYLTHIHFFDFKCPLVHWLHMNQMEILVEILVEGARNQFQSHY